MTKKNDQPRDMANDIIGLIREGTKKWTKTRKAEERSPASRSYRYSRMTRERGVSVQGSGGGDHGDRIPEGERPRQSASQCPPNHVRRSSAHPESDRQAA